MRETESLPPSSRARLSALGWVSAAASLVLGATLFHLGSTIAVIPYCLLVGVGFLVGVPAGMQYQADVDAYLAKHPGLSRAAVPWPAAYTQLSRKQAWRYSTRGLPGAVSYGFLMPVLLLLGALSSLRILRGGVVKCLYKHRESG